MTASLLRSVSMFALGVLVWSAAANRAGDVVVVAGLRFEADLEGAGRAGTHGDSSNWYGCS